MAQVPVRNWKNQQVRTVEIDDAVLAYPLKRHLIYEAVCAYRAGGRAGTHKTKNRVEVSGGTKKLWKQKHTGTQASTESHDRPRLWHTGVSAFIICARHDVHDNPHPDSLNTNTTDAACVWFPAFKDAQQLTLYRRQATDRAMG